MGSLLTTGDIAGGFIFIFLFFLHYTTLIQSIQMVSSE